ncbi:MAG: cupredoxin domain-containing protein [Hyphomicrobiales bacterium]
MRRLILGAFAGTGALGLLFTACDANTILITIDDLGFGAPSSPIHMGDVVEWRNRDIVDHTATAKDGSFDVAIEAGGNAKVVMQKPGEIEYFCRYHPNMTAKINVIGEP